MVFSQLERPKISATGFVASSKMGEAIQIEDRGLYGRLSKILIRLLKHKWKGKLCQWKEVASDCFFQAKTIIPKKWKYPKSPYCTSRRTSPASWSALGAGERILARLFTTRRAFS